MADHRLGPGEGIRVAPDHHRQHAVLRASLSARHRRVEEGRALGLGRAIELARDVGRSGGVVDEHRAGLQRREGAVLAGGHRAQIVVVADACEHEIGVLGRLGRGWRGAAAISGRRFLGLGSGAVIDGEVVSALGPDVPRHRKAHHAKADPCDFAHALLLVCGSAAAFAAQPSLTKAGS